MLFGLIGESLKHSFSRDYFTQKFIQEGLPHQYQNFELSQIADCKAVFEMPNLVGLNVTHPYKQAIIPYLNELSVEAKAIGAVNTIVLQNGYKKGYNTDYLGFQQLLAQFTLDKQKKALVFGTGGAAQAVLYALQQVGIAYQCVSRVPKDNTLIYAMLQNFDFSTVQCLINTTPVGMYPAVNEALPLPYTALGAKQIAIDLIYNPEKTLFLQKAQAQGAQVLNGYVMLVAQAEAAWKRWQTVLRE